jgi:hypothetical protein
MAQSRGIESRHVARMETEETTTMTPVGRRRSKEVELVSPGVALSGGALCQLNQCEVRSPGHCRGGDVS